MKIKKKPKQHSSHGYGGRQQILSAGRPQVVSKHLEQTASQNRGPAISCAPALFEIIKKSLGGRIDDVCNCEHFSLKTTTRKKICHQVFFIR